MTRAPTEKNIVFMPPGRHGVGDGLYLYVSPDKQVRRWIHRYTRPNGQGVTETGLGPWPVVTLEDARAQVLDNRRQLRAGTDPIQAKKATRQAGTTFRQAAEKFITDNQASWSASHIRNVKNMLFEHGKAIASVPVGSLTQTQVQDALAGVKAEHPNAACRSRAMFERVLDDAGLNGSNPARFKYKLPRNVRNGSHFNSMDYSNLPAFFQQLDEHPCSSSVALKFLILTATRTGEVMYATRDEFDGNTWTIPATRTKTGKLFRVPLSTAVTDIVQQLLKQSVSPYIFNCRSRGKTPPSHRAVYHFLRDHDPVSTVHGYRASFRT